MPARRASSSTTPPEKIPTTSLIVLPIAAAAIVVKLNATHRVVSSVSPARIMIQLSRNPKATNGIAEAAKTMRSWSRVGGRTSSLRGIALSTAETDEVLRAPVAKLQMHAEQLEGLGFRSHVKHLFCVVVMPDCQDLSCLQKENAADVSLFDKTRA